MVSYDMTAFFRQMIGLLSILLFPIAVFAAGEECKIAVGTLERTALVFPPSEKYDDKAKKSPPLVLCFHGHGGSATSAARSFGMHLAWPEACVVYPQGIPTPGRLTDPEGKQNGWQFEAGSHEDRDLRFFDALLDLCTKKWNINPEQVFVMGHSNGGAFSYLLWSTRFEKITAVAPSAAVGHRLIPTLRPKPCFHAMATNDKLVLSTWQEWMVHKVQRVNQCQKPSTRWSQRAELFAPIDPMNGARVVIYRHDQGHRYPKEVTQEMVRFFQECSVRR
jgi:polyhydroxybutyrate depolymerase